MKHGTLYTDVSSILTSASHRLLAALKKAIATLTTVSSEPFIEKLPFPPGGVLQWLGYVDAVGPRLHMDYLGPSDAAAAPQHERLDRQ